MRLSSLFSLVGGDLRRARGALGTSGFGIAAGTASLTFFVALGLGVRGVLLGDVFPIDQIELEPPKGEDPGLMGLLFSTDAPGIDEASIATLKASPDVEAVYPKLKFAFPASARGGKDIFGKEVGASEMVGDGIEPALLGDELAKASHAFVDPLEGEGHAPCEKDEACGASEYCEIPSGEKIGRCSAPVPVVVSPYLVEIFDKSIAPAHRLPPIGKTLVEKAEGLTFQMRIGESALGKAKKGAPRTIKARLVGTSRRAIDLGLTMPLGVVKRLNREYAGDVAAEKYSSVLTVAKSASETAQVIALGKTMSLEPKDTRARDVSVLITSIMGLLTLVASIILVVSATNIAYTFRVLVAERRGEIALMRALGAKAGDMRGWILALSGFVGGLGGVVGVGVARLGGFGVDRLAAAKLPDFPFKPSSFFAFPWWLSLVGVGFGMLFAMLGALGPARRAAKVDPATALADR